MSGAHAPRRDGVVAAAARRAGAGRDDRPAPRSATIAAATRSGASALEPDDYARALNRDVLVPRPAGRFLFGRLISRDEEKLQILPLGPAAAPDVVANPPWLGVGGEAGPDALKRLLVGDGGR